MDSTSIATHLAQFYAATGAQPPAGTSTPLHQSINAWLSYYRCLPMVIGVSTPTTVTLMRETFYPFAYATLDHLAATFCLFFALPWSRAEMNHTRLTRLFPALCMDYRLHGETDALSASMRDLHDRIIASHASHEALPDELIAFLHAIERYIVAMLRFFAHNRAQSIYRSHTSPEQAEPVVALQGFDSNGRVPLCGMDFALLPPCSFLRAFQPRVSLAQPRA